MIMMSHVSKLEIIDWKEEKVIIDPLKPKLVEYFTEVFDFSESPSDMNFIRYFDNNASFNLEILQVDKSRKSLITFASVLSTVMNTPFNVNSEKRKWHLNARIKGNLIFLYPGDKTVINKFLATYREVFKNHFFVRKPTELFNRISSNMDQIFYEIYKLKFPNLDVYYVSDLCGIISEQSVNNFDKLIESEHVICELIQRVNNVPEELIDFNPICWSKAVLTNSNHCILGVYNKYNALERILYFDSNKYNNTALYGHIWSPLAAWNFLNIFLTFITDELDRIDEFYYSKAQWEFTSFADDQPFVICEYHDIQTDSSRNCAE
ncbi:hypothetical protein O3M35_000262 [Rhynocoris fuscipes]|uniref:Uncharacterized protein n=1 Tax=Rhynocoris fuscipes TaxID=488301 RepID=A0AAW1DNS6_9HEMI